jgi:hypothetical protein
MRRRVAILVAIGALVICAGITAMCAVTVWLGSACYVDRDLHYYRGANGRPLQGLDQARWQGTVIYLHSRRIEWAASLADLSADHEARPWWHVGWFGPSRDIRDLPIQSFFNRLGFQYYRYDINFSFTTEHHYVLAFPAWLPVLILLPPGVWVLRKQWWLHRRRRRAGLCATCGYDLRGTPERCPECGETVSAVVPARSGAAGSAK